MDDTCNRGYGGSVGRGVGWVEQREAHRTHAGARWASTHPTIRPGFTMLEATVALALLMIVAVIIAQAVAFGFQERARTAAHAAALELAANLLESARAHDWDGLDPSWADAQRPPADMDAVLPAARIKVTVVPLEGRPACKKVTAEVFWQFAPQPVQSVAMTTLLSRRDTPAKGGTP